MIQKVGQYNDATFAQQQEYLRVTRVVMADAISGAFLQGNGQIGIKNEALLPKAIEDYNTRHPEAPLPMPELALFNFREVTGVDWVPGGNVPRYTEVDGVGRYQPG